MAKKKYYAIVRGRRPGIYRQWYGGDGAHAQVEGFPGARFKGFCHPSGCRGIHRGLRCRPGACKAPGQAGEDRTGPAAGSAGRRAGAPHRGLYGRRVHPQPRTRRLGGGHDPGRCEGRAFRRISDDHQQSHGTDRCHRGVESGGPGSGGHPVYGFEIRCHGIVKGWARRWRANGWMRNKTEKALNADLWERLLGLCETCTVDFRWVKGHAGVPENERCDRLAGKAAREKHLPPDSGYKTETNVH